VPQILKVTDSFGQVFTRAQCRSCTHPGGIHLSFNGDPKLILRPKDILTIDLEIDPSYETDFYKIEWSSSTGLSETVTGRKAVVEILNSHVGESFDLQCSVTTIRDWHRLATGIDDFLIVTVEVLPPLH
jgi:hypothetical protein